MPTKVTAWILSFLSIFFIWGLNAQPNPIPETRGSPYGETVPDKYGTWPTEEFEKGKAPLWLFPNVRKAMIGLNGFLIGGSRTDSFLVLHKGKLVYERYYNGYGKDTPHFMASVTKSVTSALVGVAIGEGYITSVKDKVVDYFPEARESPQWQESKANMTIEHVLTMTSGILCDTGEKWEWFNGDGVMDTALNAFLIPQSAAPGKKFMYENAAPSILLGIVERATGHKLLDYAQEKLFGPLGMTSVVWDEAEDDLPFGAFGISMTPRDMARFGYLYLNYGRWDDQQIIPADYVAVTPPRAMRSRAYGYMFWNFNLEPFRGFYQADGALGQYIIIMPSRDTVIVRTGDRGPVDHVIARISGFLGL